MNKRYKVGYTTGVFDLFHIGHLNILKKAKSLCDYLIVGVSTDDLVLKYKKKKTFIPEKERFEIVKSISYVDNVRFQTSIDKTDVLGKVDFDVMFHGDDWKNSPLFFEIEKKFKDHGIDLVFFEYTQDTSSTKIKELLDKNLLQE